MFKSTQGRLTRIYSGIIMLFLIFFVLIVYSILYVVILNNQERELQSLMSQEASFIENYLVKNDQRDISEMKDQEVVFAGVNQYFYYVVNTEGQVLMGNETDHRLRPDLLRIVNGGRFHPDTEIRKETLYVERNPNGRGANRGEFHPDEGAHTIHLMIAGRAIYDNGQYIGQLYIGKDITFVYQLFHWLLVIIVIIGIIFFGVALSISVVMSRRAMVPITGAFTRQREFVADASHELRTPLSVLLSSIDAIEMTIEPEERASVGKMLSNIRQEVKRMTNLVTDLLTLARSDSNTIELQIETMDLCTIAEKMVESVRPLATSKQISLNFLAPPTLNAVGDPQKLSQLLYILLDNAIKYTSNGGEVKLILSEKGHELEMRVQDTGIGIHKEEYAQIFKRFYRVDKSRSRQMGGHGLGLSIAKWIVEAHKGTIRVSSEIGKGSTFIVTIPV